MTSSFVTKLSMYVPKRIAKFYVNWVCRKEYEAQRLSRNERLVEFGFVLRSLLACTPEKVLDVGTGLTALPHMIRNCGFKVTAIDNVRDYWGPSIFNRHYHVVDNDITAPTLNEKFDFISCVSVLEHIKDHRAALRGMFSLLREGGHIALTFPYTESRYVENVYRLPEASYGKHVDYVCQSFSRQELDAWLEESGGELVEQEYWQCYTGWAWVVGEDVYPPKRASRDSLHQLSCVLLRKKAK